ALRRISARLVRGRAGSHRPVRRHLVSHRSRPALCQPPPFVRPKYVAQMAMPDRALPWDGAAMSVPAGRRSSRRARSIALLRSRRCEASPEKPKHLDKEAKSHYVFAIGLACRTLLLRKK